MGDELFLRSRCSEGAGCHCSGMEHFYVPDSTDRAPNTSSRSRRPSHQAGRTHNDSIHSANYSVRPALSRPGGSVSQSSCTAALLASVFDQVSGAPAAGRQGRSRRHRSSLGPPEPTEEQADTSGLPDLSYLAYSSDDEYDDFMRKPRTDYTYSRSLSYTIERPQEVGPPSMSRLGLHSPGHGAGDSPILGRTEHAARPAPSRRTAPLAGTAASPALAGGGEQNVYESTSSRVYSYRREITSRVSACSLPAAASVAPPLSFVYSSAASGALSVPRSPAGSSSAPPRSPAGSSALLRAPSSPAGSQNTAESSQNSAESSQNSAASSRPTPSSEHLTGVGAPPAPGTVHGLTAGLDADSQDEEWLPTDAPHKLGTDRCSTPSKIHADWSARRGARLAVSPLLWLWLLVAAGCRHLWSAVRPLLLAPVPGKPAVYGPADTGSIPANTLAAAAASRAGAEAAATDSLLREEPRSQHRYQLRPRLTPQRDALPTDWPAPLNSGLSGGQTGGGTDSSGYVSHSSRAAVSSAAAPGGGQPGRLVTALAWLAAVLWFVNPLRWAAASGRAAISRVRTAAEVLDLPRGAATAVAWLRGVQRKPAGSAGRQRRPGWLRSAGALLWAPAAAATGPAGSGSGAELWHRSRSVLDTAGSRTAPSGGQKSSGEPAAAGAAPRRYRLTLRTAALLLLLLLLTLLLLPIIGWLGRDLDDGTASAKHALLPAQWWPVWDSAGHLLAGALSSVAGGLSSVAGGLSSVAGGLSSLAGALSSLGVLVLSAAQATVAQLGGSGGSAAPSLWVPGSAEPAAAPAAPASALDAASEPAPGAVTASDPRVGTALSQLDQLRARVDLLQSEYQSCRAASEHFPAAAVRAALGLPPDSPALATTERLAAVELRLQRRLAGQLAAVSALLRRQPASAASEGRLAARLVSLEAALPAAERASSVRLDSLSADMEQLRTDMTELHGSLAAVRAGLQRAATCCSNGTQPDWSDLLGAQIGRLESHLEGRMQVYTATIRRDLTSETLALAGADGGVSRQEALDIAQRELALYDADKTGKFDFALESAGGSIVSTKCTEAYTVRSARLTVLGVPLWYPANNPRSIIQPHMQPGECFAFQGEGQFVVGLSRPVRPSEFVMEHIARGLTPGGSIESAPRHCSVLSVAADGEDAELLASFEYSASGAPLQRFAATVGGRAVSAVELRVASNWGHPEYTCLYRFRVHGEPEPERASTTDRDGVGAEGGRR